MLHHVKHTGKYFGITFIIYNDQISACYVPFVASLYCSLYQKLHHFFSWFHSAMEM